MMSSFPFVLSKSNCLHGMQPELPSPARPRKQNSKLPVNQHHIPHHHERISAKHRAISISFLFFRFLFFPSSTRFPLPMCKDYGSKCSSLILTCRDDRLRPSKLSYHDTTCVHRSTLVHLQGSFKNPCWDHELVQGYAELVIKWRRRTNLI
ncbi:hypothetical protein BDZ45DRAFT_371025 [Acephala macrosclerotiorum]|nr:hypothetical protein BDZ45DRAFT_371025 [Acephala macrosclerotiorum]